MKNMGCFRKVYVGMLIGAFLYSILQSYMTVLEQHTTVEESRRSFNATFPSVSLCLINEKNDTLHFTTMNGLHDYINKFLDNVSAELKIGEIGER